MYYVFIETSSTAIKLYRSNRSRSTFTYSKCLRWYKNVIWKSVSGLFYLSSYLLVRLISIDLGVAVIRTDRHTEKPIYSIIIWDLGIIRTTTISSEVLQYQTYLKNVRRIYWQINKWVENVQEFGIDFKSITWLHTY